MAKAAALIMDANALGKKLAEFLSEEMPAGGDARVVLTALTKVTVLYLGVVKADKDRIDLALSCANRMFELAGVPAKANRTS